MPRSRLGPLAIESKLGDHPSQSNVWRAIHVQLKKAVAVKVFASPFGGTPEARAELAKEWETLKKLEHPAIVRCYGGGFEEIDAYLAHELIEGETLSSQLELHSRIAWESALDLAESLAEALQYLHAREIYHGAIQPDKILIAGLSPVLIDVRVNRTSTPYTTNRPPGAAELALRAPELFDDPTALSPQTDLYSLGATLYVAITGKAPVQGDSLEELAVNVQNRRPESAASIVMECPVWLDKVVMQLLEKDPSKRPYSAEALSLALAEARRRSMSRAGAVEHASAGFSPLNVTDQKERDAARILLGRATMDFGDEKVHDGTQWHEKPWVLMVGLLAIVGLFGYFLWPLDEDGMRQRAEELLQSERRTVLHQAKVSYLEPMLARFPDGQHASWAHDQIDRIEMLQAEHALSVKIKRNFQLQNEGERLYAEAHEFERFGDLATALDKYQSMVTLLGDDPEYRAFVNLALRQIGEIENNGVETGEAARLIQTKLDEAEKLLESGNVVSARKIWYSIVELYGNNGNVAPLVAKAQQRLAQDGSSLP